MSQPIGSHPTEAKMPDPQPQCGAAGFFRLIGEGFEKAFTPCEVYCKEKWKDNPEIYRTDYYMQRCIRDCKDFQKRIPD